ncbi:MAG: hypothetical protein IT445_06875 [Phycisphaeraceae bacterium]|nr:hypothetical protein [Phycisphaeraceae bacterium]
MATTIGKLNVILSAVTMPFKQGLQDANKSLNTLGSGVEGFGQKLDKTQRQLDKYAKSLKFVFTLGGIGAIASLVARQLERGAAGIIEIQKELATGAITSSEAFRRSYINLTNAIPLYGSLQRATLAWSDAITGVTAAQYQHDLQAKKLLDTYNEWLTAITKNVDQANKEINSTARSVELLNREMQIISAGKNTALQFELNLGFDLKDKMAEVKRLRDLAKTEFLIAPETSTDETRAISRELSRQADELERAALNMDKVKRAAFDKTAISAPIEQADAMVKSIERQISSLGDTLGVHGAMADFLDLGPTAKDILRVTDAFHKLEQAQTKYNQIAAGVSIAERLTTPLEDYEKAIEAVTAAWKAGKISVEQMESATKALGDELDKATEKKRGMDDVGEFRQVSLSRTALNGGSRLAQAKTDQPRAKQIDETNKRLDRLIAINERGAPARLQ